MTRENQVKFENKLLNIFETFTSDYIFYHIECCCSLSADRDIYYLTANQCKSLLAKQLHYSFPLHYLKRALKKYRKNEYYVLTFEL